jgi:hypothetical protein
VSVKEFMPLLNYRLFMLFRKQLRFRQFEVLPIV